MSDANPTLEERLARIDAIVSRLEDGRIDLEDALALFEEGVTHIREADRILREAELKIERLVAGPGGTVLREPVRADEE